jgi:diadenosine tetraphosphate (Ap4A) HIT family hydrolase
MNATLEKFGYPHTLLKDFTHWSVLLRPAQVTLAALVLASKHEAMSFGTLPLEAHTELHKCTSMIERALKLFRPYEKLNYIALMMVDPHVHFHVLPRYNAAQDFDGTTFADPGWPNIPDFKSAPALSERTRRALHASLLDAFAQVV